MRTRALVLLPILAVVGCGSGAVDGPPGAENRLTLGEDGAPVLPNWATPDELAQPEHRRLRSVTQPPSAGFRVPAEYEPAKAVVITWTSYTTMLKGIAKGAAAAGAQVWAIGGPSSISGVPAAQYKALSIDYDSVWIRDYGPFGVDQTTHQLGLLDSVYRHYNSRTADDAVPCALATSAGAKCFSNDLVLDGGNFMTDSAGNVFVTRRIYEWNSGKTQAAVDKLLTDYYGAKKIHRFDYAKSSGQPADGTGHIDMFVKLLSDCKVLVAQTSSEPFKSTADAAASYFAGLTCPGGGKYQIFRIPAWTSNGTWYTYTNSTIVNQKVLMPSFSSGNTSQAIGIYQSALPGYEIVAINSDSSITAGGAIHCTTQVVPAIGGSTCTPSCSGKSCGSDGCGGSCGSCSVGQSCSAAGQCTSTCTPNCSGKACGSDGCGGSCGSCTSGQTCSAAGQCTGSTSACSHALCTTGAKLVSTCDPCVAKLCAQDSYCCSSSWDATCVKEVGTICGQSCGSTCTPSCSGKTCGSDGCGGSCGTCSSGQTCSASGQCTASCTPSCSGKSCGSDGCGGSCGTCSSGQTCSAAGQCTSTGGGCAHAICTKGAKLSSSCDPCVKAVCAQDSYCCNNSWDATCVKEVGTICGQSC